MEQPAFRMFGEIYDQLSSGGGTVMSVTCVKQRVLVRGQVVTW